MAGKQHGEQTELFSFQAPFEAQVKKRNCDVYQGDRNKTDWKMQAFPACIRNCFLNTSYIPKSLIRNLCKHVFKSCFQAFADLYKHQKQKKEKKKTEKERVMKSAALIVLSLSKNPSLGTGQINPCLHRVFSHTDTQGL